MNEIIIRVPKTLRGVVRVLDTEPWPPVARPRTSAIPTSQVAPAVIATVPEPSLLDEIRKERRFIESALIGVRDAIANIERNRQQQITDWQTAAIELALTISTRLFHQEVDAHRFPLDNLVRDMVQPFVGSPSLRVYLNPIDLRDLKERFDSQALLAGAECDLRFTPDPTLARGDCRVEDGDRVVVSQLAEKLRMLREDMLGGVGHEAA